ncbi:DUF6477 family protein [Paenirhodobacter sp.]|uniref:DUF6477 family protein n=1 Tax=Paenirhodobacter sp. TaxID=1965326 RepID=UPI003B3CAEF0
MFDQPAFIDLKQSISALRRPRLLVRAARCGQQGYHRARDLKRLVDPRLGPGSEASLRALVALEERLEHDRAEGAASYSFARHVDVLIALMAESRAWRPRLSLV